MKVRQIMGMVEADGRRHVGCAATGNTIEECVAHMKEAIAFHFEGLAEDGDPIPDPTGPGVYVERSAA